MQATIDIVLPVFGLTLCGWLVGKSPLLTSEGIRGINNYTLPSGSLGIGTPGALTLFTQQFIADQ